MQMKPFSCLLFLRVYIEVQISYHVHADSLHIQATRTTFEAVTTQNSPLNPKKGIQGKGQLPFFSHPYYSTSYE